MDLSSVFWGSCKPFISLDLHQFCREETVVSERFDVPFFDGFEDLVFDILEIDS